MILFGERKYKYFSYNLRSLLENNNNDYLFYNTKL